MKVQIGGSSGSSVSPTANGSLPTVSGGYTATHITTSTTTLVHTGPCVFHAVVVNTKGTVASQLKVYDGIDASGTLLAIIDSLNLSGTFSFDIACVTGIAVVTTGAPDVTIIYL